VTFLLDTNVISEWVRPRPDENVVAWLAEVDEEQVFMSVVSFAELRRGVDLLPAGRRRSRLEGWIAEDLAARFHGRVLDVDRPVADTWGRIMARCQRAGRMLGSMDAFFAATAASHELTLVTRNVRDFESAGIPLCNPWEPS
jgi:predicted nucleic acid-binding protein